MRTHNYFGLGIMTLCALLASWAGAQELSHAEEKFSSSSISNRIEGLSSRLRGRSDFSNRGREWVAELEQAGIVNRSLRGPYRVAVPLMSFGARGPKLMITYARRLPGSPDERGVLLFIHIPTD